MNAFNENITKYETDFGSKQGDEGAHFQEYYLLQWHP